MRFPLPTRTWFLVRRALVALGASFAAPATSEAQVEADKADYHLFNPTPRDRMREMSTDRPDVTESPYTVDAGHVQIELSFVEYTRDSDADFRELAVLPMNLKLGLLNNVDIQLVLTPYVDQDFDSGGGPVGDASGFGESQVRLKVNLWGNDGGKTALAVMPFLDFPTSTGDLDEPDEIEGGLIIPFATELGHGVGLGLMAEFDFVRASDDGGYELEFVHTASLSRGLTDELGGYLEYIGVLPTDDDAEYAAALGAGLTYGISPDVQLDGGLVVGLNDEADDLRLLTGISFRL